jgi:hypothetical protein
MTYYHAVFEGEDGSEFGAGCEASSREEARRRLEDNYPESRIVQLESPEDTREREAAIYARVSADYDYDYDATDDDDGEEDAP